MMQSINDIKRAAITAYFLDSNDREWIIENLSVQEADKLNIHLKELDDLGLPRNEETKKKLFSQINIDPDDLLHDLLQQLIQFEPAIVREFINQEDAWLTVFLIRRYPLLFDKKFLNTIKKNRKSKFKELSNLDNFKFTSTCNQAVLKSIREKLSLMKNDKKSSAFSAVMDKYSSTDL